MQHSVFESNTSSSNFPMPPNVSSSPISPSYPILIPNWQLAEPETNKRIKRSEVPREQREFIRRLKKQNMERRRRACISDKMTTLHNLAVTLVGQNPQEFHRVEKADILNNCIDILQGLSGIVEQRPDLQSKLRALGASIQHAPFSQMSFDNDDSKENVCSTTSPSPLSQHQCFSSPQNSAFTPIDCLSSFRGDSGNFSWMSEHVSSHLRTPFDRHSSSHERQFPCSMPTFLSLMKDGSEEYPESPLRHLQSSFIEPSPITEACKPMDLSRAGMWKPYKN